MINQMTGTRDVLSRFRLWGDQKKNALLIPHLSQDPVMPIPLDAAVEQKTIFRNDFKRHIHALSIESKYELASLIQSIATIAISPFALVAEIYRLCKGSIPASVCLKNICSIPKHILVSIANAANCAIRSVNKVISAFSISVGFLAWHGGERLVRLINGASNTALSNHPEIRDIVYRSIGLTMLAAAAVFIPIAPIQMFALPIIFGSLYGTLNNQFTIRQCPEYYTMGHYYDGTDLKGHAIKTNNLLIKPIITGCYATASVTKLAGAVLAATGTIPYTAAILPVPYAAIMIAGVSLISLVAAHIFSTIKKNAIQKNLNAYAALVGIEWNETNRNKTWSGLAELRAHLIEKKQQELSDNPGELNRFNEKLDVLTQKIESDILHPDLPMKYIAGWQANNTRNGVGYLFAGGGTLALAISTIFLRIFAL